MNAFPVQKTNLYTTKEEFMDWCKQHPDQKFEFVNSEIVAMAGASRNHNRITRNFINKFSLHLEDTQCEAFGSDMFVECKSETYEKLYLPDVVIDCADEVSGDDKITRSPILIVEVVSKSTRENDFSQKLRDYQKIPSLQEYVIVEQDSYHVYVFQKSQNWQAKSYNTGMIYFESIDYSMSIEEIYQRVIISNKS